MPQDGKHTRVWHAQYAFTGDLDSVEASREVAALETTAFGDDSRTYAKGQKDGGMSISGFYSDTLDDATAASYGGTDVPLSVSYGSTAGSNAYILKAIESSVATSNSVTELIRMDVEYKPSVYGIEKGVLLLPETTTSGVVDTAGATYDRGVETVTGGAYMILHVTSAGASGTLTVTVETNTASDFSGTAQDYSFTAVGTSETSEYVESSTSPKRYARVGYVTTGASSAYTFAVTYGHAR